MANKIIKLFANGKLSDLGYGEKLFKPHVLNGYKLVLEENIDYKEDGSLFKFYKEVDGHYVEDTTKTVESLKETKKTEITTKRKELENGVFDIELSNGNTYPVDADLKNRSNMHQVYDNAVHAQIPLDTDLLWKMGDNNFYTITYSLLPEIGTKISIAVQGVFNHENEKHNEIELCGLDAECIENVQW